MATNSSVKNIKLGKLVAQRRIAKGRSARDVAREANIDIHTMTKLEKGYYNQPSPITLKGVAKALDIPVLEIFHAAGYLTPYDLIDLVRRFEPTPELAAPDFDEARNRYIEELIEKHGLDYLGPDDDTQTDQ